ncbi:hypothetical protein P872_22900 [Rhodonellum psychrophilum GCM71 = DSM 17998]|uniref:Uncharacterized protein n=1 Tax=Rhodonellum psychrophilum GCM71 = DSM 17998 TaxID=1123057 RepID=U5C4G4_9BACT|nr:hypothetical protein P872_22900 [Rhodonellum psychrophilum GCM71 = DSM 17998]
MCLGKAKGKLDPEVLLRIASGFFLNFFIPKTSPSPIQVLQIINSTSSQIMQD